MFQHFKGRPSGQCRVCKTKAMKAHRLAAGIPVKRLSRIEDGRKLCLQCEEMKPLADFSPAKRGLGGVMAYCKECFLARYPVSREERRAATAAYRKRHPERWAAMHRLHQFERRTQIKATTDGSVTDAFLKALYATRDCIYCGTSTPREQRTADHKQPLSRGGHHTAANMVMACKPCNSAKSDMTFEEFMETLK